jgi:hypothetical protein
MSGDYYESYCNDTNSYELDVSTGHFHDSL